MKTRSTEIEEKKGFWRIAFVTLAILGPLTIIMEILMTRGYDGVFTYLGIPLVPGLLVYALVTGDIELRPPGGPIGQNGRVILIALTSVILWSSTIYSFYRLRHYLKNKDK